MNLKEEIDKIKEDGYNEANAESKLCQDIILKAISQSGMASNTTIKGGVVMRSISKSARRATQDIDLDFIRYSISNDSIKRFVEKLNCLEDLEIYIDGKIIDLKHQDYKGKRIAIRIKDKDNTELTLKMDIGVHSDLSIEQEEYAFDIAFQDSTVSLLINSKAQMITEKLKSLVRFGSQSTRYKDIFDIYFLLDDVNIAMLKTCIKKYIFDDETLKNVNTMDDIIKRIDSVFRNEKYIKEVEKSNKNWIGIPIKDVIDKDINFLKEIKF